MSDSQIVLAPAAGSGIGKKLADALLADEEQFVASMVGVVNRGMHATRRQWDHGARQWTEEPDCKTQVQTLALVLAHMEGEPVKRIIHQHLGGQEGKIDVGAALADSPELQAVVERELQKSRWRTSGHQPHKRPRPKRAEPVVEGEAGPAV